MTGIYKIQNIINNKVYIGQAIDIEDRWRNHLSSLRTNTHVNTHLQNSFNYYGEKAFIFSVIEECSIDILTQREQFWIDYYGGINSAKNYNQRDAGSHGTHSEESKRKISESQKGIKKAPHTISDEGRKSLSKAHIGIKPSDETRIKMSMAHKGITHTKESKKKISEGIKEYYNNNPDMRKHLAELKRNRSVSQETRNKISEISKNRKVTEATRLKCSESLKQAYKECHGKFADKQKIITIYNITMNQTNWAKCLNISRASIIQAYKKGDEFGNNYIKEKFVIFLYQKGLLDVFIEELVEKKGQIADALVDGKVSIEDINYLLS
nr:MAG TPA: intron associated endonuclease [Bacteriophage sp.]